LAALLTILLVTGCARAHAAVRESRLVDSAICQIIAYAASVNRLPVDYLSRLLWTESRFRSAATSPAGAQGIAQFMPQTALEQGLHDPRDPASSIINAARLLVRFYQRFGNLGLAAAAYNAGPTRLTEWLHGSGILPAETHRYVRLVTGRSIERWIKVRETPGWSAPEQSCAATIAEFRRNKNSPNDAWPIVVLSDGSIVSKRTGEPLSVTDRLALHNDLYRAVGLLSAR
jgi:Transglycosylase SLT domain